MKFINLILLSVFAATLASCDWAKEKAKQGAQKGGKVIAETGAEFASGVSDGVEKAFRNKVEISEQLKTQGLRTGKITINSTDSTQDNILTVYLIFDDSLKRDMHVKIFDQLGQEYGRANMLIEAKKGEAKYVDFVFDKRTNIDGKSTIIFE